LVCGPEDVEDLPHGDEMPTPKVCEGGHRRGQPNQEDPEAREGRDHQADASPELPLIDLAEAGQDQAR
jgi:hypothetical protein